MKKIFFRSTKIWVATDAVAARPQKGKNMLTSRDFYKLVINATSQGTDEASIQMAEYATAALQKLDAANAKARNTVTKEKAAVLERKTAVYEALSSTEYMDRDQIAAIAGCSAGQATSALTALVREGWATKGTGKKAVYIRVDAAPAASADAE